MEKIYPITNYESVIDDVTGNNLVIEFNIQNHINIGKVVDKTTARVNVPSLYRKTGLHITYYTDEQIYTEMYVNPDDNISDDSFIDDSNWVEIISVGLKKQATVTN